MPERLDKILATQGIGTRTQVKALIKSGAVTVNNIVCRKSDSKAEPESDIIKINGKKLEFKKHIYIMMNKPAGVLSASTDKKAKTVIDLLPPELKRKGLFPAGRLDKDTEGLLIITDDGEFAHNMLHPKKKVYKLYYAEVDNPVNPEDIEEFKKGIVLRDGTECMPAELSLCENTNSCNIFVKICEGKFHQVKKMLLSRGKFVEYLKRISIGALKLDENLVQGCCKELTIEEANKVFLDNIN